MTAEMKSDRIADENVRLKATVAELRAALEEIKSRAMIMDDDHDGHKRDLRHCESLARSALEKSRP